MKEEIETLNCYNKLLPKWTAIIVAIVGISVAFFISTTSWVFYFWLAICTLFIIKTLRQKKETIPAISISKEGIKLENSKFYTFKEIKSVKAYSKNKLKFRSIDFKLLLTNGSEIEFSVDNLDVKPQKILDIINNMIK